MSSTSFGSSKQHGVIYVHPGCFRFLQTTKFKQHYESDHLKEGETYSSRHRDDHERALLDPNLLEWGEDGPLKAVFVASLMRVSHYLDDLAGRIKNIEAPLSAQSVPTPPTATPNVAPVPVAPVEEAAPAVPAGAPDEQVQESEEEKEPGPRGRVSKKRAGSESSKSKSSKRKK